MGQNESKHIEHHLALMGDKARKLGLKEPDKGPYLCLDGLPYVRVNETNVRYHFSIAANPFQFFQDRLNLIGLYTEHEKSLLAFVDGQGRMNITSNLNEDFAALATAGYKERKFKVSVALTDRFGDQKITHQFEQIKIASVEDIKRQNSIRNLINISTPKLLEKLDGPFLCLDGVVYLNDTTVVEIPDPQIPGVGSRYLTSIGHMNVSKSLIGFVDVKGSFYIGKNTTANQKILHDAGYRTNNMLLLPFTNGEMPLTRAGFYNRSEKRVTIFDTALIGAVQELVGSPNNPGGVIEFYNDFTCPDAPIERKPEIK